MLKLVRQGGYGHIEVLEIDDPTDRGDGRFEGDNLNIIIAALKQLGLEVRGVPRDPMLMGVRPSRAQTVDGHLAAQEVHYMGDPYSLSGYKQTYRLTKRELDHADADVFFPDGTQVSWKENSYVDLPCGEYFIFARNGEQLSVTRYEVGLTIDGRPHLQEYEKIGFFYGMAHGNLYPSAGQFPRWLAERIIAFARDGEGVVQSTSR